MSFSSQAPSIIVADDDKSVRIVIGQALKKQGYHVHTTATAAGMWDTVNAKPDALLITDVGFPDGDALDMLPRLLERHPKLRVIVMSARADLLTAVQTQQQGAIDYLPKPFELSNLLNTTKSALNQTPQSPSHSPLIDAPQNVYAPLLGRSSIMQDVYKNSNGRFEIGYQDEDTLKIIMRSIYLQNAANNPQNIRGQVEALNQIVADYCVPQICSEAEGYIKYKNDVSTLAVPLSRPVSTYNSNILSQKTWF